MKPVSLILSIIAIFSVLGCTSIDETDYRSVTDAYVQAIEDNDVETIKKLSLDEDGKVQRCGVCTQKYEFKDFEFKAARPYSRTSSLMEVGYSVNKRKIGKKIWERYKVSLLVKSTGDKYYMYDAEPICKFVYKP